MTTAGMAAARPNAVASRASAMPGATTARLVVCDCEMPMKLFMMPQTVPNRPTTGAVAPIVASTPVPRAMRRPPLASTRSRRVATRSLMPSQSMPSSDKRSSVTAAATSRAVAEFFLPKCCGTSARRRTDARIRNPSRTRRRAMKSSIVLASQTVQVTNEAMTRPIRTAFTTESAAVNMPQGLRSRGSSAAPTTGASDMEGCVDSCAVPIPGNPMTTISARIARRMVDSTSNVNRCNISTLTQNSHKFPTRVHELVLHVGKESHTGARQQHLVLGVGNRIANVGIAQVVANDADIDFARAKATAWLERLSVAHFGPKPVVAGCRGLDGEWRTDWRRRDVVLRQGVQQVDAGKPIGVTIEEAAAEALRRNARHVGAVGEGGTDDVPLAFDAPYPLPERRHFVLELELAAAEGRVLLR